MLSLLLLNRTSLIFAFLYLLNAECYHAANSVMKLHYQMLWHMCFSINLHFFLIDLMVTFWFVLPLTTCHLLSFCLQWCCKHVYVVPTRLVDLAFDYEFFCVILMNQLYNVLFHVILDTKPSRFRGFFVYLSD